MTTLKIKLVSDLHLEFSNIELDKTADEKVLILSGDILLASVLADYPAGTNNTIVTSSRQLVAWRFREFLKDCSETFEHVIYVAGNHELYHGKFNKSLLILKNECDVFPNIHFLENRSVVIDDVTFVGATLWTDCNNYDPLTILELKRGMSDYSAITYDDNIYRKLIPEDTIKRHKKTLEYLQYAISNATTPKVVVVGHHAPTFQSIDPKYADDVYINGGYASNLTEFILNNPKIVLWTHGHTHCTHDYMIGSTRVMCNPRGYKSSSYNEETGWNPDLVIDI